MKNIKYSFLFLSLFILVQSLNVYAYYEVDPDLQRIIEESSSVKSKISAILRQELPIKYLKIKVTNENQLTRDVNDVFRDYGFDSANEGYDILIGLVNDHNVYSLGLIKERGDDFGYTHGMIFEIGKKLKNGNHIKFKYSSDLFSKPIDGEVIPLDNDNFSIRQNITNENIAKLVIDNYDLGKLHYWKGEVGWHQLSQDVKSNNVLLGSTQQLQFHRLLNSIHPGTNMIPINVDNGAPTREGIFTGFFIGSTQIFVSESSKFRLKFQEEVGAQFSAATHTLYKSADINSTLTFHRASHKLGFEVGTGIRSQTHSNGVMYTHYFDLGIGRSRKWRIGVRAEYYHNDLNNDSGYNLINPELPGNDPVARIYFQYFTH